jgi:twinkle protein
VENTSAAQRTLGPIGVAAMEKRGLNPETAAALGVITGRIIYSEDEHGKRCIDRVEPDDAGNILVFPIIEKGEIVGEKYRGPNKFFFQKPGSKQTFINGDALDDPQLYTGQLPLVVVEGEPDMITAIDVGFPLTVSVPAGAPPPPKNKPDQVETEPDDSSGKFEFMWHNRERLKKIRRFIIAVDNDTNGQHLAEELVRRLGAARCSFVTYSEGCKDLNDVLMKHGADATAEVLKNAKPYPLQGLYFLSDYPDKPQIETFKTGWPIVDTKFMPFAPCFAVVTGLPGSGKSTWLTNLAVNMAADHGWKWAVFSPELPVVPHLRDKLRRIYGGADVSQMNRSTLDRVDAWINRHFVFIDYDVTSTDDQDLTLDWILDRAYDAVMRHGIRGFILDPWNEVEHAKGRNEPVTEYTNRALRQVIKFGRRHGLFTAIVAHPTKDVGKDGKLRVPSLYDIEGSAAWFNKPDIGIVVHRPDINLDRTEIHLKKVRFESTGERGHINLNFNRDNSRYEQMNAGGYQGSMDI